VLHGLVGLVMEVGRLKTVCAPASHKAKLGPMMQSKNIVIPNGSINIKRYSFGNFFGPKLLYFGDWETRIVNSFGCQCIISVWCIKKVGFTLAKNVWKYCNTHSAMHMKGWGFAGVFVKNNYSRCSNIVREIVFDFGDIDPGSLRQKVFADHFSQLVLGGFRLPSIGLHLIEIDYNGPNGKNLNQPPHNKIPSLFGLIPLGIGIPIFLFCSARVGTIRARLYHVAAYFISAGLIGLGFYVLMR